jgi:hypothetical protein
MYKLKKKRFVWDNFFEAYLSLQEVVSVKEKKFIVLTGKSL